MPRSGTGTLHTLFLIFRGVTPCSRPTPRVEWIPHSLGEEVQANAIRLQGAVRLQTLNKISVSDRRLQGAVRLQTLNKISVSDRRLQGAVRLQTLNKISVSDRRLQGAALVAVRHKFNIHMFADGHEGRTLQAVRHLGMKRRKPLALPPAALARFLSLAKPPRTQRSVAA